MLPRLLLSALLLASSALAARAEFDRSLLGREIVAIEKKAQGRLGVALLDLRDRAIWSHRGAERFPMQSVFKLPLGITALQAVEAGKLSLEQTVPITRREISLYHSPLAERFKGERQEFTLREVIRLATGESDNTATDVLMRLVGGPHAVTRTLADGGIAGIRVDRYERVFQPEILGLPGFDWDRAIDRAAFRQQVLAVPEAKRRAGLEASFNDARDTATPEASVTFLEALAKGSWLREPAHRAFIMDLISNRKVGTDRIKAGLPAGATLAHRTGLGPTAGGLNHATNDIGLVTLADGRRFAIAVYLAGSTADAKARAAAIAATAKLAVKALR